MRQDWYIRGAIVAIVTILAVYMLVPSYFYFSLDASKRNDKTEFEKVLPSWAPEKHLNLGLDLQGGIHLVMEVDVDAALTAKTANRAVEMQDFLERKEIKGVSAKSSGKQLVELTIPAEKLSESEKALDEYFNDMEKKNVSGTTLSYAFRPESVKNLRDGALDQSIKALRNRVDKFGVAEPTIARRGDNHILVQLPGFKDPEQAKELIGKTAQLEFRLVNDEDRSAGSLTGLPEKVQIDFDGGGIPFLKGPDQKALQEFVKGKAPAGFEYALSRIEEPNAPVEFRTYLLKDKAELTGEYLTDARVQMSDDAVEKRPHVTLTFNRRGADLFEKLTGENIQKRMAIVLDGIVDSAPTIQSRISGGSAMITLGGYKPMQQIMQDAQNLALVLKAGALPAPVTIAEQRSVGASLGPELINSGTNAVGVGLLLVILFMAIYYSISGVVADIALLLNGVLILASLAFFGASLSLPGIAGIVLTLGVAVDANVIINERIREELHSGKSASEALALGYDRAFAAIFDSNLTTILSGLVLLQYGTGPIRGFAITLIVGVSASMFTAIFVTRWIMDFLVAKNPTRLSV